MSTSVSSSFLTFFKLILVITIHLHVSDQFDVDFLAFVCSFFLIPIVLDTSTQNLQMQIKRLDGVSVSNPLKCTLAGLNTSVVEVTSRQFCYVLCILPRSVIIPDSLATTV